MNLDLINDLFNNLKENKFMQNFMKELSNYLEKSLSNNSNFSINSNSWINLSNDNLTIYNTKITAKFRDEMLIERNNILQDYAKNINSTDDIFYVYDISHNEKNSYNLYNCKTNEIITKAMDDLPSGSTLGSILTKKSDNLFLDTVATKNIENKLNNMFKEKISEQTQYLAQQRIDGHIYEIGEKSYNRIWLYDSTSSINGVSEGFEEIDFPEDLYTNANENDLFIFKNGKYQKFMP